MSSKRSLSSVFAHFLVHHAPIALLIGLALLALTAPGLKHLSSDFSYRIWFLPKDSNLARFDAFERRFGNDESVVVVAYNPKGMLDREGVKLIQEMTRDLWQVREVIRVDSISNFNWVQAEGDDLLVNPLYPEDLELSDLDLEQRKQVALTHEITTNYLVNHKGDTAMLFASLQPAIGGSPNFQNVMDDTRAMLDRHATLKEGYWQNDQGYQFYLTGTAAISQTFKDVTQHDMTRIVPLLIGVIVLFLLFTFRRVSGIVLPFVVILATILAILGFAGWIGYHFNNLTSIVPHIMIAICIADSVHIFVSFLQNLALGLERREALFATLEKNLLPTFLTSFTTSVGFLSFATAELKPVVQMGVLAGVGTLFAWLITILIMVPLLRFLPIKAKGAKPLGSTSEAHPRMIALTLWIRRYRRPILLFYGLLTVTAIGVALLNQVNSDPFKYFAPHVHTRLANEFAQEHVGGTAGFEIVVNSGKQGGIKDPVFLKKVEAYETWLKEKRHITKTVSITDIIKQSNRSFHGDDPAAYLIPDDQEVIAQEYMVYTMQLPQGMDLNNRVSLDESQLRITALSTIHNSREGLAEIQDLEAKGRAMGIDVQVTGKMPLYHGMNGLVVESFIKSIFMAVIFVSIIMMLTFKSVRTGLLSMIPNLVPLCFGGAFMTLMNKPLDIGTVLVTSTCLGIAVDDTIHFLANYERWRKQGMSKVMALAHVFTHTGEALVVTTLILVVAFGTFIFADFVPNINFGILVALVLSSALITDLTLLPALILGGQEEVATEGADFEALGSLG